MRSLGPKRKLAGLLILLSFAGDPSSAEEKLPFPFIKDHCLAVRDLLEGKGEIDEVVRRLDATLDDHLPRGDIRAVGQLLTMREAALQFTKVKGKDLETARLLFGNPRWCSRFFHNLDSGDDLAGALSVLRKLHDRDGAAFSEKFEFCLAYAVVWDNFAGHSWLDSLGTKKNGTMLESFEHFLRNEKKMVFKPGELPCEVNVYIVGMCLSREDRDWALRHYTARKLKVHDLYSSVPWTLDDAKTVSPAHGKGLDIPYTLENIMKIGGCCMEQAYFTESILRLFGVPAVFAADSGHAWVGVAERGAKDSLVWDFDVGGGGPMPRMVRGIRVVDLRQQFLTTRKTVDPTNAAGRNLSHAEVMLCGGFWTDAGSIKKIEESHFHVDAARWMHQSRANGRWTEEEIGKREKLQHSLLVKSQKAGRFNIRSWRLLESCAKAGTLPSGRALFWAREVINHLLKEYPDLAVPLLEAFVSRIDDVRKIKALFKEAFKGVEGKRPDLVCDLKIIEAKAWLALKKYSLGVNSLVYLIENFANTPIAMDPAPTINLYLVRLLPILESSIEDEKELVFALESLFQAARNQLAKSRHQGEREKALASLQKECGEKLYRIFTDQGDMKRAKKYSRK